MNEVLEQESFLAEIVNDNTISKEEIRELIARAEANVSLQEPIEIPLTHHFSKDVYAREVFLPKGSLVIGKIHRFENLNILSKGDITVLSIDGCKRVQAPYTVVSSPGVKRLVYCHEDCVWTTIHGTNEKDVDKIEQIFIAKDYQDHIADTEIKKIQE